MGGSSLQGWKARVREGCRLGHWKNWMDRDPWPPQLVFYQEASTPPNGTQLAQNTDQTQANIFPFFFHKTVYALQFLMRGFGIEKEEIKSYQRSINCFACCLVLWLLIHTDNTHISNDWPPYSPNPWAPLHAYDQYLWWSMPLINANTSGNLI